MSSKVMDGVALAKKIERQLMKDYSCCGLPLSICAITVGDSSETAFFLRQKKKMASRLGINLKQIHFFDQTTEGLIEEITRLNNDPLVHGIFLQHPLPKSIDEVKVAKMIALNKDVDGLNPVHFSLLATNQTSQSTATANAIMALLEEYQIPLMASHVVILGRSNLIGKPLSLLLLQKDATVTLCHHKTKELSEIVATGDIVIVATGVENTITSSMLKKGSVLIDAGYHLKGCGDVTLDQIDHLSYYTKVPGGVGPVTVAMLFDQFFKIVYSNQEGFK